MKCCGGAPPPALALALALALLLAAATAAGGVVYRGETLSDITVPEPAGVGVAVLAPPRRLNSPGNRRFRRTASFVRRVALALVVEGMRRVEFQFASFGLNANAAEDCLTFLLTLLMYSILMNFNTLSVDRLLVPVPPIPVLWVPVP